jgi:hypothetical protein
MFVGCHPARQLGLCPNHYFVRRSRKLDVIGKVGVTCPMRKPLVQAESVSDVIEPDRKHHVDGDEHRPFHPASPATRCGCQDFLQRLFVCRAIGIPFLEIVNEPIDVFYSFIVSSREVLSNPLLGFAEPARHEGQASRQQQWHADWTGQNDPDDSHRDEHSPDFRRQSADPLKGRLREDVVAVFAIGRFGCRRPAGGVIVRFFFATVHHEFLPESINWVWMFWDCIIEEWGRSPG